MLEKAKLTTESLDWEDLILDLKENVPDEIRIHLSKIVQTLRIEHQSFDLGWLESQLLRTESCLDRTWEVLNSGHWKNVPLQYRYAYTISSLVKAILLEINSNLSSSETDSESEKKIIEQIDKGILLGAPLPRNPTVLTSVASRVNKKISEKSDEGQQILPINEADINTQIFPGFKSVEEYSEPSMETFYRNIFSPKTPAILKGCMKHWRALDLWRDSSYLKRIIGSRTVPIEIGSRYTEEDWSQTLVTFADFLKNHIDKKNKDVGYLAQHQLFDQIPELKNDFSVPEYCSFADKDECPDINAWFGPGGTVSPLHFDPKNNLLCQVFGCKRIILYHPEDSPNLYPYETRMLNNTAQVDPYRPDDDKFPNFRKAEGFMCYLKPGEMLFIPPKWWHSVVSLSPSFSVSFWWE